MSKPNDDGPDYKAQVNSRTVIAEEVLQEDDDNLPRIPPVRTLTTPDVEESPDFKAQVNSRTSAVMIAEGPAVASKKASHLPDDKDASLDLQDTKPPAQFGPDFKHQTREVNPDERKPAAKPNVEEPPEVVDESEAKRRARRLMTNQAAHIAVGAYASSPAEARVDVVYPITPPSNTLSSREQTLLLQAELVDESQEPAYAQVVDESQTERRARIMTILSIVLVVFIASSIAVIGAVCGSGKCGGGGAGTSNPTQVPSSNPTQVPSMAPTVSMFPTTLPTQVPSSNPTRVPSMAPTVSMFPTTLPTVSPPRPFTVFDTTEQLYEAVDNYSADPNSETSLFATTYGYPIGNWDVSRITNFARVFDNRRTDVSTFNEDLSGWNVSAATTMFQMFYNAPAFNGDLSAWDTSSVTDMSWMFYSASAFNGDLSAWDTSRVTTMRLMFEDASAVNGDLSAWNTSSVTTMVAMFYRAPAFNGDLSAWDTSRVTNMAWMFRSASTFNGDLSAWDTSSVTDMTRMFNGASAFNSDLSAWDTSSVTETRWMFSEASAFNQNLCPWGARLPSNADVGFMFDISGCPNTTRPVLPDGPFCHPCS